MADRVLTVRGTGNVSVKPDLIIIGMTLAAQHRDYAKTMENAASEIESLRAALLSVGFEKDSLKTIDFNVDTAYESEKDAKGNWKRRFDGYRCIHKLKLEFDLDMERLNDTLTAISSSKAVPEFQINFSIKNQSAVSEQLLREAIRNASEKAAILASAAGVSLGKIQRIDYDWSELRLISDTHYFNPLSMDMHAPSAAMDIEPDDIETNDSVTVIWEIA